MGIVQFLAIGLGAFYALGGLVIIRGVQMDHVLTGAIAAIEARRRTAIGNLRTPILGLMGVLTGAGGVALAFLSSLALPIFVLNLFVQLGWMLAGTQSPDDDLGRQRARNATMIYAAATAFVIWLDTEGQLRRWDEPAPLLMTALTAAVLAGWLITGLRRKPQETAERGTFDPADQQAPAVKQRRVRLALGSGDGPITDSVSEEVIDIDAEFTPTLASEIRQWENDYRRWFNAKLGEDEYDAVFGSIRPRGERIAEALRQIYGAENVEGPIFHPDFDEAGKD